MMLSSVKRLKKILWLLCIGAAVMCLGMTALGGAVAAAIPEAEISRWIDEQYERSQVPGMAVVIVDRNGTVYSRYLGHSDAGKQQAVGPDSVFELGSLTKSFTGLALLKLEQEGRLRLDDPVTRYLDWFQVSFEGSHPEITLAQLLHHTSGIPFKSIGLIPPDDAHGGSMLEQTVRKLVGIELDRKPGEQFNYATVNYDVLGLVVEKVTGEPFDAYLQQQVIAPLGLSSTYAGYGQLGNVPVVQGFKPSFLSARPYQPPQYSGNMPAGYVLSSSKDMARWMRIQMGAEGAGAFDASLLERSHEPDRSVPPTGDGSSYAAGWSIHQRGGGEWSHAGVNPTFSSYMVLRPGEQLGVAVLTNMNSERIPAIGQGIMDLMMGRKLTEGPPDSYVQIDRISLCLLLFAGLSAVGILVSYVQMIRELLKGQRTFGGFGAPVLVTVALSAASLAVCLTALYHLPYLLFWDLPWDFVEVWGSPAAVWAVRVTAAAMAAYALYAVLNKLYPKPKEKPVITMVIMSLASGFGNAFIVFMINRSFQQGDEFDTKLFLYFVMGILFYVFAQKVVRSKLVHYANTLLYEKRMEIVDLILGSRFSRLDRMEKGKLNAALISDTETIAGSVNTAISGITSLITLVFCFTYLGFLNLYGLLLSFVVILGACAIYYKVSSTVRRLWETTRDLQNVFFRFAEDLLKGFKELSLHARKRKEFRRDMDGNSRNYKDMRAKGDLMFANVFVIGELIFTLVIGIVAFMFPVLFPEMGSAELRNYVFVFLYMTGPVNGMLHAIPQILNIRISWNRVNALLQELASPAEAEAGAASQAAASAEQQGVGTALSLSLRDVVYSHDGAGGSAFTLGPVDYTFRTGEIVFITGGNGSGKSTLSRLITGLSSPDEGQVLMNGEPIVNTQRLGEYFSTVFSDFHLFERMYGLDVTGREDEIQGYLKMLQLEDKVQIREGVFSTTKLSTGQRKRLALLLCYLDDRPFYLFDEWAADQDPEYREYFYTHLLQRMKQQGKGIIAITHDDRYFHLADHVLKLEFGQVQRSAQFVS